MNTQRFNFLRMSTIIVMLFLFAATNPARGAILSVINTNDSGAGSLRQAIASANGSTNVADTINFAIPGTGPHTIAPVTPLPNLTDRILIDGYSQSGSSSNTLSAGDNAVLQIVVLEGLIIDTTNSTVR